MADSTSLPNDRAALVDSSGQVTRIWFQFFRGLGATTEADAVDLSGYLPNTVTVLGPASIKVDGTLGSGAATFRLDGDSPAPGNIAFYGTSLLGVKGWHPRTLATEADVDVTGLASGNVLEWVAANSKFEPAQRLVSVVQGTGITVDNTDPANPIINAAPGGGLSGVGTITLAAAARQHRETIAAVGVTAASVVSIGLRAVLDADENDPELMDAFNLWGLPGTDTIDVYASFDSPESGPIKINWRA